MVSPRWEGRTRERPQHAGGVAHKAERRAAGTRAAGGKRKRDSTTCVNGLRRKCGREAAAPDPLWWSARRRRRRLGTAAGGSAAVTRAFWVCGGHRGWRKRLQGEGGGHGGPFVSNEVWSRGPSGWRRPARCRAADAEGVALPNGRGHQKHSTTGELPSSELEGGGGVWREEGVVKGVEEQPLLRANCSGTRQGGERPQATYVSKRTAGGRCRRIGRGCVPDIWYGGRTATARCVRDWLGARSGQTTDPM